MIQISATDITRNLMRRPYFVNVFLYCLKTVNPAACYCNAMHNQPGRTAEQKSKLSGFVLDELKRVITHDCSLSVEVVDIDGDSYAKVVV